MMRILDTIPFQFVPQGSMGPQLRFWTCTLGYETLVSLPPNDPSNPDFVALQQDDRGVMLRTLASAENDMPSVVPFVGSPGVALYHKVDSLKGFDAEAEGLRVLLGVRETSYGALEVWVRDPAGYVHAFGEKVVHGRRV